MLTNVGATKKSSFMYVTVLSVSGASEINMANVTCAFARTVPIY